MRRPRLNIEKQRRQTRARFSNGGGGDDCCGSQNLFEFENKSEKTKVDKTAVEQSKQIKKFLPQPSFRYKTSQIKQLSANLAQINRQTNQQGKNNKNYDTR